MRARMMNFNIRFLQLNAIQLLYVCCWGKKIVKIFKRLTSINDGDNDDDV